MTALTLAEVDADHTPRCCAKCRTPYFCGNKFCTCHAEPEGTTYQ